METSDPMSSCAVGTVLPLLLSEIQCNWPATEENKRRQEFCNKLEGYGSVCSCSDPAPVKFDPPPVSCPSGKENTADTTAVQAERFDLRLLSLISAGREQNV